MTTLAIVGAGPKAVAVAVKARVMRELGLPAPDVVAVESRSVGAHWTAEGGWTDGQQRLGTSPEKDLGFPYRAGLADPMLRYSWQAYLVDQGGFADWVDRGKPNPKHRVWADYLRWAARRADLDVVPGAVSSIGCEDGRWRIRGETTVWADALMLTGPGAAERSMLPDCPQVLSVARFWQLVMGRELPEAFRVAVVGGGETAAAVVNELIEHREIGVVTVVSPNPTVYTRGESYFENTMYSDPSKWLALSSGERRELIRRTDRGVFSAHVQGELLRDDRVGHLRGRVGYAAANGGRVDLMVRNPGSGDSPASQGRALCASGGDATHSFDLVVDAVGGHPLWFLDLFAQEALDLMELAVGWPVTQEALEASIGHDLSVTGLRPKLFLPNLAGPAQGPGFPNLSCLGLLSDRVLGGLAEDAAAWDRLDQQGAALGAPPAGR
ncbi:MAG: SidA/IucD/PvdA family monooxygenase [Segniliparus sp.]|uniref:SidA/IucD/PvdA family monooxygenase n=1 Tax=Segniliparus sp. TaxID=2804064 RepID=UPI003F3AB827